MNYTPKIIKRILKKCINEISAHPELFAKNPGRDFTRERKLPFDQILKSVLSMTEKSLRGELMDYLNLSSSMPTVSAFVQQRNKIDYRAFEIFFGMFYEAVDEQKLFGCLLWTAPIFILRQTRTKKILFLRAQTVKSPTIFFI